MGVLEVPLHEVNIKSSLINGNIVIGMIPSLPVEGISLIHGNDLAGEKPRDNNKAYRPNAHLLFIAMHYNGSII